jgi:hypothetical protein
MEIAFQCTVCKEGFPARPFLRSMFELMLRKIHQNLFLIFITVAFLRMMM